jgi:serine/threonine-protein kinase
MPPEVRSGGVVSGKFRIDRVLGEGGMGVVVAATHLQLDEPVALKFLRSEAVAESEALGRFMREAKAAAKLKSEHVARVLDVAVTDEGSPYIVMEYLEGRDLSRTVQGDGPLDVASATEFVIQACEGLSEAHARGIVHRDIKPENLFLVERTQGWKTVKILDFGISKIAMPGWPTSPPAASWARPVTCLRSSSARPPAWTTARTSGRSGPRSTNSWPARRRTTPAARCRSS